MTPLLTLALVDELRSAAQRGEPSCACSLDLARSATTVQLLADGTGFLWQGQRFPWPSPCREHTVYCWDGDEFRAVARFAQGLYKLVPTTWGPPTFEIDGIKMLPTAQVDPWEDARRKVALVQPQGQRVLDSCGGLGYFAAHCLAQDAASVLSFEKSAEVIWLREVNPWSPAAVGRLELRHADVALGIAGLPTAGFDAILHDPPRFGIAGELYSQAFYDQLARVLRPRGRLFHYTGTPNRLTSGRDVPGEVSRRLTRAGFSVLREGDGLLARRR